jgi:hypothetical protein
MSDQSTIQPKTLRDSLLDRPQAIRQETTGVATMVHVADALHRLERLAEAMERVAAEGERQLAVIRGRL